MHYLLIDISDNESIVRCEDVVGKTVRGAGLNLLISNAGICVRDTDMNHVTPANMMAMYQVNAVGPLLVTRVIYLQDVLNSFQQYFCIHIRIRSILEIDTKYPYSRYV